MIDYLKGTVVHRGSDHIIVDVHDIGYKVFVPSSFAFKISNEQIVVYTYHHLRAEISQLFGFESRQQQSLFLRLIEVSNIGPKVALGVLSVRQPDEIITAIRQQNLTFLNKLPGIGKKTAQQMILDLKDKLDATTTELDQQFIASSPWEDLSVTSTSADLTHLWREAREGLAALGYTTSELDKAWVKLQEQLTGEETVDTLMKRALQQLFKG